MATELNKESTEVDLYVFTDFGLRQAFYNDAFGDLVFIQISLLMVAIYCIMFMGSFSPIHFRSAAAGITLLCVIFSFAASSGLASFLGFKKGDIHNLLPFLLIGIGADDMFVISSAIDQTDSNQSVTDRIKVGMMNAGTSITITSLTSMVAFLLGTTGQLAALASFCFYAAFGIFFLYFSTVTLFASFMVWDLKRQHDQKGDCCGACSCPEDTALCCKGSFLTEKQKAYPYTGTEPPHDAAAPKTQYTTGT